MMWVRVCGLIISLIMTLRLLITQLCYPACRRHPGKAYHLFYSLEICKDTGLYRQNAGYIIIAERFVQKRNGFGIF